MGILSISEMIAVVRKYFLKVTAVALLVGILAAYIVSSSQTYTCTLGFKYNYDEAEQGLAPDGESKLDPYEIQNPVIIQAALHDMGLTSSGEMDVKGIRENISITPIVTELDQEVSDSAALLGEKYEVFSTEYEMKFTYKASKGDSFGSQMFSNIIKEYDEYFLANYYNKKTINDFTKTVLDTKAEYIVIADSLSTSLDDTISYLDDMAASYPEFRSKNTGYSFSELSLLYQNLRDIQYAKYYGNIRAGNLAIDKEMVIKSYQKKVKTLQEDVDVYSVIAENYKQEISTFYDSYKAAGLYGQAEQVQQNVDSSNNRDQDVLTDEELEEYQNTYDEIILNYTKNANAMTDANHSIDYYNKIIDDYTNDMVSQETKDGLLKKNETILQDMSELSKEYSEISNKTLNELYSSKISEDLQYLILPETVTNKPVKLIAAFAMIVIFGFGMVFALIVEVLKKFINTDDLKKTDKTPDEKKVVIDTEGMDELHQLLYEQYLADFSEFFVVYQPMVSKDSAEVYNSEVFVRWDSPELGMVSPGKIISGISDFNIFRQFNDWLIKTVCEDLAEMKLKGDNLPIIHINCPCSQVENFGLNDIIMKHVKNNHIPIEKLCLELDGKDIANSLEDIMLLSEMGIRICIDRFGNTEEESAIVQVVKPRYIKLYLAEENTKEHFKTIIQKCHKKKIKVCICGIENETQDKMISEAGFDYKQGFYYGKPEKLEKGI